MEQYLSYLRDGEKIYYLNKEGRDRVECTKVRKKSIQVQHYLMRNELYLKLGRPATWRNEIKFGIKGIGAVIADAMYQKDNVYVAVEVDHTQKMSKNRKKIETYKKLRERVQFNLIWLTVTEYRKKQLEKLCEGLNVQVYTMNDIK